MQNSRQIYRFSQIHSLPNCVIPGPVYKAQTDNFERQSDTMLYFVGARL